MAGKREITEIKKQIIDIGKCLYEKKLTTGMSGNISFRVDDRIFITSTGTCLGNLTELQVAEIDMGGNAVNNDEEKPSSEKMMHVEIYKRRPEVKSIIHAHPPFSTSLSIKEDYEFLPILAEPVVLLGNIPRVKYEMPSTDILAKVVAEHFIDNNAVLMSNHGATVVGKSLKETFYKLETLEFYSQVYLYSGLSSKRVALSVQQVEDLKKLMH